MFLHPRIEVVLAVFVFAACILTSPAKAQSGFDQRVSELNADLERLAAQATFPEEPEIINAAETNWQRFQVDILQKMGNDAALVLSSVHRSATGLSDGKILTIIDYSSAITNFQSGYLASISRAFDKHYLNRVLVNLEVLEQESDRISYSRNVEFSEQPVLKDDKVIHQIFKDIAALTSAPYFENPLSSGKILSAWNVNRHYLNGLSSLLNLPASELGGRSIISSKVLGFTPCRSGDSRVCILLKVTERNEHIGDEQAHRITLDGYALIDKESVVVDRMRGVLDHRTFVPGDTIVDTYLVNISRASE